MKRARLVLFAFAAACGGAGGSMGDGDVTVSLALERGGAPAADVPVVIHGVDGKAQASLSTDENGELVAPIENGGMVTVVDGRLLRTIADVQQGDLIAFDLQPAVDTSAAGQVVVDFDDGGAPGAAGFGALVPCAIPQGQGGTNNPANDVTIDLTADCRGDDGLLDVLGVAFDNQGFEIAFAFVKDLDIAAGETTTATLPAFNSAIDFATITVTNFPEDTVAGSPQNDPRASVVQVSSDKTFGFAAPLIGDNASAEASFGYDPDFAELLGYTVAFNQLGGGVASIRSISQRVEESGQGATEINQNIDTMLGQIDSVFLDAADPLRPIIRYSGPNGDAAVGVFGYGEGDTAVVWFVMHIPDVQVQLPELPGDLASSWEPPSPSDIQIQVDVFDTSANANYADVRQTGNPLGDFDFAGPGSRSERSTSFPMTIEVGPPPSFARARARLHPILAR